MRKKWAKTEKDIYVGGISTEYVVILMYVHISCIYLIFSFILEYYVSDMN